jgi:hypothetical protein
VRAPASRACFSFFTSSKYPRFHAKISGLARGGGAARFTARSARVYVIFYNPFSPAAGRD